MSCWFFYSSTLHLFWRVRCNEFWPSTALLDVGAPEHNYLESFAANFALVWIFIGMTEHMIFQSFPICAEFSANTAFHIFVFFRHFFQFWRQRYGHRNDVWNSQSQIATRTAVCEPNVFFQVDGKAKSLETNWTAVLVFVPRRTRPNAFEVWSQEKFFCFILVSF